MDFASIVRLEVRARIKRCGGNCLVSSRSVGLKMINTHGFALSKGHYEDVDNIIAEMGGKLYGEAHSNGNKGKKPVNVYAFGEVHD
jgi:hypothetical protein